MSLTPLFSIIVPFYNLRAYMDRCIKSILHQSYQQLEIILIDDGSTDGTAERLKYWEQVDPRIRLYLRENHGVSATRNFGVQVANGQYVTFIDGDDWIEHQFVEFMVQSFQQYRVSLVTCGFYYDPRGRSAASKRESGLLTRKEMMNRVLKLSGSVRGYAWNKAYVTQIIKDNQLKFTSDIDLMEDQLFNVQYINLCERFYFDTRPLYHYIQRSDSLVHAFDLQKVPDTVVANYRILLELNRASTIEANRKKELRHQKRRRHYAKNPDSII